MGLGGTTGAAMTRYAMTRQGRIGPVGTDRARDAMRADRLTSQGYDPAATEAEPTPTGYVRTRRGLRRQPEPEATARPADNDVQPTVPAPEPPEPDPGPDVLRLPHRTRAPRWNR